jgi:hypothetical protein
MWLLQLPQLYPIIRWKYYSHLLLFENIAIFSAARGGVQVKLFQDIKLRPISTQEKFPRTENLPKISLLKITFYKIFFLRKIFRVI